MPDSERPQDSSRPTRPEAPPPDVLSWLAYGAGKTRRIAPVNIPREDPIDELWTETE